MSVLSDAVASMQNIPDIPDISKTADAANAARRDTLVAAALAAGAIAATGGDKYLKKPDEAIAVFDMYYKALQARG